MTKQSYTDIAKRMGVSKSWVPWLLRKALRRVSYQSSVPDLGLHGTCPVGFIRAFVQDNRAAIRTVIVQNTERALTRGLIRPAFTPPPEATMRREPTRYEEF